jgi:hypothetical protein
MVSRPGPNSTTVAIRVTVLPLCALSQPPSQIRWRPAGQRVKRPRARGEFSAVEHRRRPALMPVAALGWVASCFVLDERRSGASRAGVVGIPVDPAGGVRHVVDRAVRTGLERSWSRAVGIGVILAGCVPMVTIVNSASLSVSVRLRQARSLEVSGRRHPTRGARLTGSPRNGCVSCQSVTAIASNAVSIRVKRSSLGLRSHLIRPCRW